MEWEAKYYPNHYPLCQSVGDLKTYIELRKTIYKNEFKNELEHCFSTKCQENYATAELTSFAINTGGFRSLRFSCF